MIQYEGLGWRVARDSSRAHFPVMLGADRFAIELTHDEWNSLESLISNLLKEYQGLLNQLMEEESLSVELERNVWWGCLEGDRKSWSLQLVLDGKGEPSRRGVEIYWPSPASKAVTDAMRKIWDSSQT